MTLKKPKRIYSSDYGLLMESQWRGEGQLPEEYEKVTDCHRKTIIR